MTRRGNRKRRLRLMFGSPPTCAKGAHGCAFGGIPRENRHHRTPKAVGAFRRDGRQATAATGPAAARGRGIDLSNREIAAIGHTQSQGFCGDFFLKTFFVSGLDRLGECNRAACSRRAIDKECHHEPRRARRKIAGRPASLGGGAADRHRAAGESSDDLGDRPG